MSFADLGAALAQLQAWLAVHQHWAYPALFLGAFLETLIPFSLLVLGEAVFLAGALLAGMGVLDVWTVLAVLYGGGILGDNASYWLGRHYGEGLFERLTHWPLIGRLVHRKNYDRGVAFFRQRGALAVFIARLSGPLSWITPALAGIFRLNYATFLKFNTPAVLIGIGEFVIVGYFFGDHLELILGWLHAYAPLLLLALGVLLLGIVIVRRIRQTARRRAAEMEAAPMFGIKQLVLSLLVLGAAILGALKLLRAD